MTALPDRTTLLLDLKAIVRRDPQARRLLVFVDLLDPCEMDEALGALGWELFDRQIERVAVMLSRRLASVTIYHLSGARLAFLLNDDRCDRLSTLTEALGALRDFFGGKTGIPLVLSPCAGIRRVGLPDMKYSNVLRTVGVAARCARAANERLAWYDAALDELHRRTYSLFSALPAALRQGDQFHLVYQPRIHLGSGRCVSAEALLRWKHPVFGSIQPDVFLPLVEKAGLIRELTNLVMRKAVAQVAAWKDQGIELGCSFNISARNLSEPDLADRLAAVLREENVDPAKVEIEIVEDHDLDGSMATRLTLEYITARGVRLAIDDFGSGYSKIAYLLSVPASTLKIDRSLVARLGDGPMADTIVTSIIDLGHKLGYTIVAEGVEDAQTLRALRERGCDQAQGYFISRPMAAASLVAWLGARRHASRHFLRA